MAGFYWKFNKYNWKRYGFLKRLHRGVRVKIFPTFKCSLNCYYCGNKGEGDNRPSDDNLRRTLSLDEWKWQLSHFPVKIREVVISGGEPTIWPEFIELASWILDQGWFLTVFTNLTNKKLADLPESNRLRIYATFHGRVLKKDIFVRNYAIISKRHRIDVNEIAEQRLPFSKCDAWGCKLDQGWVTDKNYFWIAPDGSTWSNCNDVMMQGHNYKDYHRVNRTRK